MFIRSVFRHWRTPLNLLSLIYIMSWSVSGVNRTSFKGSKKSRHIWHRDAATNPMRKKSPFLVCNTNIPSIYFTAFCFGSSGFANLATLIEDASVDFGWILTTFFLFKNLSILNGGNTNNLTVHNALIAEFKQFNYIRFQTVIYVYSKQG